MLDKGPSCSYNITVDTMIKINVAEIKKSLVGSESFQYTLQGKDLDITPEDADLTGPIRVDGTIANGGDVLLLTAAEKFTYHGTCARCLKPVQLELTAHVDERYYPEGTEGLEEDAFTYKFDVVDVTDALRESLLLAIPARVLCKPDCKGICPVCGVDRNVTECHCDDHAIDPRWQKLEALLKK